MQIGKTVHKNLKIKFSAISVLFICNNLLSLIKICRKAGNNIFFVKNPFFKLTTRL